ncbi:uncharacterized protein EV420DRAFT_1037191 [Desarmillaria tabescens]|uniref:Rad60/SUMO-like domain-containing protein n=1 Tax=Armillaria tabescens TaxID=1929756 RepID=A0AA39NEU9_ARMTA|nr:uncharacterized protein EV420DRAFT_1037191 [Desarmillaria tabescens]KAK0464330.1 hypothetical protein EV420DRAFT_1037191 [Desarmillaria tabescens]
MSRPRPRPIIKQKNAEASSSSSSIPKLSELVVKDSDEMFMRNRSRDKDAWRKLEQKNKEKKARSRSPGSDQDEDASPQRRRQKKKANNDVPSWQRNKNLLRLLSEDASDGDADLDDDSAMHGAENTPGKLKRKRESRQRSWSRSITPPPAIPIQQLQNARNVIRQALAPIPRPASPTLSDDDLDTSADNDITLDPELASIARRSKASFSASQIIPEDSGASDIIEISVRWQPHPENPGALSNVVEVFKMNRSETFRELFEAVAEIQNLLTDNLIMTYQNRRFFPSVTPHTLGIWSSAEFVACSKKTYEYMRSSKYRAPKLPPVDPDVIVITSDTDGGVNITSDDDDEPDTFFTAPPAVPDTDKEEDDGEKLKLTLRSNKTTQDIVLVVRPTTTCGAIVRAFLKKAGLADEYPAVMSGVASSPTKKRGAQAKDPRIYIEGDKMGNEVEIGEADVEDGDMVEVGGL